MREVTWMAGVETADCRIWDDLHYSTEKRAIEAASKLADEYGGKPLVERVDW